MAVTQRYSDTDYIDVTVEGTDDVDVADQVAGTAIAMAGMYRTGHTKVLMVDGYKCTVVLHQGNIDKVD